MGKVERVDRGLGLDLLDELAALGDHLPAEFGKMLAPRSSIAAFCPFMASPSAWRSIVNAAQDSPGHQEVGLEFPERIAREQRVRTEADHLGAGAQRMQPRNPRHRAVEHRDHVGLAE